MKNFVRRTIILLLVLAIATVTSNIIFGTFSFSWGDYVWAAIVIKIMSMVGYYD